MGLPYEESLDILKLPPRMQNALEEHGIFTLGDLLHCSLADLRTVLRLPRKKKPSEWWEERMFRGGDADLF